MQKYGTPPKDLVAGMLPPGVQLDANGMPQMPALPGGMPPLDDAALRDMMNGAGKDAGCPTM